MKLCTFEVMTIFGSAERVGAETPGGNILDVNLAYALVLTERDGHPRAQELANVIAPADMLAWLQNGNISLQAGKETFAYLKKRVNDLTLRGPKGEQIVHACKDIRFLAPVPRPPMIRDASGFLPNKLEGNMAELLEANPLYHKLNPTTVRGTDTDIPWPPFTDVVDYELEIAAVIGRKGSNIPKEKAWDYIAGFTIFNDASARDCELVEGEAKLGFGYAKDWDGSNVYGPFIVTSDEFDPNKDHAMIARVNGEEWSKGLTSGMVHKFDEIVSFVSQSQTLYPGELIGSGMVPSGSGVAVKRFVRSGDQVELEVEGIGVLRNRFVEAPREID